MRKMTGSASNGLKLQCIAIATFSSYVCVMGFVVYCVIEHINIRTVLAWSCKIFLEKSNSDVSSGIIMLLVRIYKVM